MQLLFFYSHFIGSVPIGYTPVKIAVDDTGWEQKEELSVKGRNGFLFKQKLSLVNLIPQAFSVRGQRAVVGALVYQLLTIGCSG